MKATVIEFRLRLAITTAIIALGYWAPWIETWHIGERMSLLVWLALELARTRLLSFTVATPVVILLAVVIAAKAVVLRVWGTAYLGSATVNHARMQAGAVMADGPYRYVRNPLYLGSWCMVCAMAFAMPPTGALFALVLTAIFLFRLILAEEAFLIKTVGDPYIAYCAAVPRLIPRLRGAPKGSGTRPQWLRAALAELSPIGVFVTFAVFSWSYDNWLLIKGVLISFGVSLVVRAFLPRPISETPE